MKKILRIFLKYYLKAAAKIVLILHRPKIIAIAGSDNKMFIKQGLEDLLSEKKISVNKNGKNFNTEFGLPLAILNINNSGYNSYKSWMPVIKQVFFAIFQKNYPQYLILNFGISDPKDVDYLLSITGRPKFTIISNINQRYLEGFKNMDELVFEYEKLVLKNKNKVFLNIDNPRIAKIMKTKNNACISYGFHDDAEWQIVFQEKIETGQKIKIKNNDDIEEIKIDRFGRHYSYVEAVKAIIRHNL